MAAWPRQLLYSPVWLGESVQFAAWLKVWAELWEETVQVAAALAGSTEPILFPRFVFPSSSLSLRPRPLLHPLTPPPPTPPSFCPPSCDSRTRGPFSCFFIAQLIHLLCLGEQSNKQTCGHGGRRLEDEMFSSWFFFSLSLFVLIWEDKYFWKGFSRFVFRGVGGY